MNDQDRDLRTSASGGSREREGDPAPRLVRPDEAAEKTTIGHEAEEWRALQQTLIEARIEQMRQRRTRPIPWNWFGSQYRTTLLDIVDTLVDDLGGPVVVMAGVVAGLVAVIWLVFFF